LRKVLRVVIPKQVVIEGIYACKRVPRPELAYTRQEVILLARLYYR